MIYFRSSKAGLWVHAFSQSETLDWSAFEYPHIYKANGTVDITTENEAAIFLNLLECTQDNHCTTFLLVARKICEIRDFSVFVLFGFK